MIALAQLALSASCPRLLVATSKLTSKRQGIIYNWIPSYQAPIEILKVEYRSVVSELRGLQIDT